MFRRLVGWLPLPWQRAVVRLLPSWLHRGLRRLHRSDPILARALARTSALRLRRRHRELLAPPDVYVRNLGRRAWLCRDVPRASVEDVRQRNLDLVVDVLERHGIEYFIVNTGSRVRHTVGVPGSGAGQVLRLLASEHGAAPVYASVTRRRRRVDLVHDLHPGTTPTTDHLVVGQIYTSPCRNLVFGLRYGCAVEFWDENDSGSLRSRRPNRTASTIPAQERVPTIEVIRDRAYRTLEPFARSGVDEVRFPIDVVYTWVDGADAAWREKKDHYLALEGRVPRHEQSVNGARYLNRDELKYSLRSLETYADWVRRIFLVTDGHVPSWLDTSHPRLCVVSHDEIFDDPRCLPTFNSHAIESRLHHIRGLADHYLYLNDDFFFGRPVTPELFFEANGVPRFFPSSAQLELGPASVDDPPIMSAAKNNRRLIEDTFGVRVTQKLKHVPYSQRRDVLVEMEGRYRDEFCRTKASRFRSPEDIAVPSALFAHYAYCTGRAVPGDLRYVYTDTSDPLTPGRLERLLGSRDLDVFCVNDTDLSGPDALEQGDALCRFLAAYYPQPSSFETVPRTVVGMGTPRSERPTGGLVSLAGDGLAGRPRIAR